MITAVCVRVCYQRSTSYFVDQCQLVAVILYKKTSKDLKIVHGKPRHSQSQGPVERTNQDVENMLATWLQDNKTKKWSNGLKFVQLMQNRAYHHESIQILSNDNENNEDNEDKVIEKQTKTKQTSINQIRKESLDNLKMQAKK
ncbi:hypothetical protein QTP88_009580 [Uroleucon formosanum]